MRWKSSPASRLYRVLFFSASGVGGGASMMVDWLTLELPDPVGLPINDGRVMRQRVDGTFEWVTHCRKLLEGSHSSSMTFRAIGAEYLDEEVHRSAWELGRSARRKSGLEISGNPAKFLQGHNLFGSCDVAGLVGDVVAKARGELWPELPFPEDLEFDFSAGRISRIDLTSSWLLPRAADVPQYLRAMAESVICPHRGKGEMDKRGDTLYYGLASPGTRAKDWALKLYWKGPEIVAHPLPQVAYGVPGLVEECNRTIRVELTLRTAELRRLGLREVGQWTAAKVREIWEAYVSKIDLGDATVNLDTVDMAGLGLKPRHLHALAAWKAGADLSVGVSRTSFYRLRKDIQKATGYDIRALCPKSNVVPLRRVVTAIPALRPTWADHLTAALAEAA